MHSCVVFIEREKREKDFKRRRVRLLKHVKEKKKTMSLCEFNGKGRKRKNFKNPFSSLQSEGNQKQDPCNSETVHTLHLNQHRQSLLRKMQPSYIHEHCTSPRRRQPLLQKMQPSTQATTIRV